MIFINKTNNLRFEICRSKLLESCWHSNWRYHSHWGPLFRILPSMAGFSGKRSVVLTESFHNLWDQITKLLNFNNFCFDWTCKLMYDIRYVCLHSWKRDWCLWAYLMSYISLKIQSNTSRKLFKSTSLSRTVSIKYSYLWTAPFEKYSLCQINSLHCVT